MRLAREYPLNPPGTAKLQITILECRQMAPRAFPMQLSSGAVRRTQRPHDVEAWPPHG